MIPSNLLFFPLRSEMQGKAVSVRFGLILEAYLSGSVDHVSVLTQQADTIGKLKSVTTLVKNQVIVIANLVHSLPVAAQHMCHVHLKRCMCYITIYMSPRIIGPRPKALVRLIC